MRGAESVVCSVFIKATIGLPFVVLYNFSIKGILKEI